MTIAIVQTCDSPNCNNTRTLNVGYHGGREHIKQAAEVGGWRAVQEFKHLCAACIARAIGDTPVLTVDDV